MSKMYKYQLLPPLSQEEYEALKADIAERGVMVPVEYDEEGNVLDGHHRVKACQELGIKEWPSIVRIGLSEDEKAEHVLKLNVHRRHLPKEWKQEKAKELREQGWSYRRIAKALGISHMTIERWLGKEGVTNVTPENSNNPSTVIGADGKQYPAKKPERKPYLVIDKPQDIERVVKAIDDAADAIPQKRIELKRLEIIAREKKAEERAKNIAIGQEILPSDNIRLVCCDFRELELEENSVDLIFTDPPYPKEYLWVWEELAKLASKVLKPGALLITYMPQYWLPDILSQMTKWLRYVWLGMLYQPGAHNLVHPLQIRVVAKPLLFFAKDDYQPRSWIEDVITSEGRQKELHEWQQSLSPALYYIEKLTQPGDLVVDPFLGSGTTALVAKKLGRRFIGCDIDASAVTKAEQRLVDAI